MKLKNFGILLIIFLFIFLIYNFHKDDKIYYVNLGDNNLSEVSYETFVNKGFKTELEKFNNDFTDINYRTTDLINDINNNKKINNKTIKNLIIKADLVTISIGNNDLNRKELTKEYIDEVINDIDILLELIRKWCKEKVIVIGVNHEYASYKLQKLTKKYNMEYIDIYTYSSLYKDDDKINLLGQTIISKEIIDKF